LTVSVRSTAERAAGAEEASHQNRAARKAARVSSGQAVEAMQGIEKSSEQITRIIGVIDDIAFQTNLLALNAGVEAARAGDAGRGFAVVASEVRLLAQRASDSAREIKELISKAQSRWRRVRVS
jgi:methyl-accepting chemotaxis protein